MSFHFPDRSAAGSQNEREKLDSVGSLPSERKG